MRLRWVEIACLLLLLVPLLAGSIWWEIGRQIQRADQAEAAREQAETLREMKVSELAHELDSAVLQYEQAHHNTLPHAGKWEQELRPYLGRDAARVFAPPAPPGGTPRRFAMNIALSGVSLAKIQDPSSEVLFFESVAKTPSAADALTSLPQPSRDGGKRFIIVYGDGHSYPRLPEWKVLYDQHAPGI